MNLRNASLPDLEKMSGENLVGGYLGGRMACAHCPVGCVHIAALREPHERDIYFYKTSMIPYDYEPIYSLGAMLGIFEIKDFLRLMDIVEAIGMDAISLGVTLAWATEALERNLISDKETFGLKFRWGDYKTYVKAVELIVRPPNEFYEALAKGVEYAASRYGGEDFALSFGSNEMPGYHTGPICYVGYLTGSRHSHLDSGGYSLDQKILKEGILPEPEKIAESLLKEEAWRQILTSLVVCLFAREIFDREVVINTLGVSGIKVSGEDLYKIGMEILRNKFRFKLREGFEPKNLRIPHRILETETPLGKIDEGYLKKAVEQFFNLLQSDTSKPK